VRALLLAFAAAAMPALAQPVQPRGGWDEWSLNLVVQGSKNYSFEGGASARNDGGAGIGLTLARNLNDYLAIGADLTYSDLDMRASVAAGEGNPRRGFDTEGNLETLALRLHATWYLLSGPAAPFLTAGAGVIFIDGEFASGPPASACWVYPFYGQVCGGSPPTTSLARLAWGGAAGVRLDLPYRQYLRVMVGGEWIEIPEARSTVGYVQLRADFGITF
jgi:hypothetical protein